MPLASYELILVFLPLTLVVQRELRERRVALLCLWMASLGYYAWANIAHLPLFVGAAGGTYAVARQLERAREGGRPSRGLLLIGVGLNVGLLAVFHVLALLHGARAPTDGLLPNAALPFGLAFFTVQNVGWLLDAHAGRTRTGGLVEHGVFASFFPLFTAGPIVRHGELVPQLADDGRPRMSLDGAARGLLLFGVGLFKQVVVGGSLEPFVTRGFDALPTLGLRDAWLTSLCFTLEVYYAMSGVADMAVGCALLFNLRLPSNFESPYRATSIPDFWRRWHITLGRILRDAVYVPLGGDRGSSLRTYRNLLLTFLVGSAWHGFGSTFLAWGTLHAFAVIVHRACAQVLPRLRVPPLLGWLATLLFVNATWVVFRARSWHDALKVLRAMVDLDSVGVESRLGTGVVHVGRLEVAMPWVATSMVPWALCLVALVGTLSPYGASRVFDAFRPSRARAWVLALAVVVGLSTFGVYAINFVVDPFSKKELQVVPRPRELSQLDEPALSTLLELERLPRAQSEIASVVVLGDSRARWLTTDDAPEAPRFTTHNGQLTINLGFAGATLEESLSIFAARAPYLVNRRLIVVVLPFQRIAEPVSNRVPLATRRVGHFDYYISSDTFRDSLGVLSEDEETWTAELTELFPTERDPERDERLAVSRRRAYRSFDVARAERRLEALSLLALRETAKLVFWIPPEEPSRRLVADARTIRKQFLWFRDHLARIGHVYDHFQNPGGFRFTFRDAAHSRQGPEVMNNIVWDELLAPQFSKSP